MSIIKINVLVCYNPICDLKGLRVHSLGYHLGIEPLIALLGRIR